MATLRTNGLGLRFAAATVTFDAGTVDAVRVNAGTEAFTLAAATEFKKSILEVNPLTGVVTEVTGADTSDQLLASAVVAPLTAGSVLLAVVEVSSAAITGLDLTSVLRPYRVHA